MESLWHKIFHECRMDEHDFDAAPFEITMEEIKRATRRFGAAGKKQAQNLCRQQTRESRPQVFKERNLFLLPINSNTYSVVKGEGYMDFPMAGKTSETHLSELDFVFDTLKVGKSVVRHVDYAYATSLIKTFLGDDSLVLTIRGRKRAPKFDFRVGKHKLKTENVRTWVDAGYEGRSQFVLVHAKSAGMNNTIIKQLYYPFRQWKSRTRKRVVSICLDKMGEDFRLWEFAFADEGDYNSIRFVRSGQFRIL